MLAGAAALVAHVELACRLPQPGRREAAARICNCKIYGTFTVPPGLKCHLALQWRMLCRIGQNIDDSPLEQLLIYKYPLRQRLFCNDLYRNVLA